MKSLPTLITITLTLAALLFLQAPRAQAQNGTAAPAPLPAVIPQQQPIQQQPIQQQPIQQQPIQQQPIQQQPIQQQPIQQQPAFPDGMAFPIGEDEIGFGATGPGQATIQYDPETDSIIVITDPATIGNIGGIIESLDRPVSQVLIKVLFLEVTHSKDRDFGIEGTALEGDDLISTYFGISPETRGGFVRVFNSDFEATLRALDVEGRLEILSRPSVLARNNETAIITIGQEVPFIRNSRITEDGQVLNTIEYDDIGIILEVTPHITAERMVEMYVYPEISTLTAETVPITDTVDAPVIAKRSAETTVVVQDGRTVVIGGLMEDNLTDTIEKVPILGDIWPIKYLFRRHEQRKVKTELLIFLTPFVVDGQGQLQSLSVAEMNQAELPPDVFSADQFEKFVDNLETPDDRVTPWGSEKERERRAALEAQQREEIMRSTAAGPEK